MGTPVYPQDLTDVIAGLQNRTKEAGNRNVIISTGVTLEGAQDITGRKTILDLLTLVSKDVDTTALVISQPNEITSTDHAEMVQVFYQTQKGLWLNEKGNLRVRRVDREVPLKLFGRSLTNPANGDAQVDIMQWFKRTAGDDDMVGRIGPSGGLFCFRLETDTGPNQFAGITTFTGAVVAQSTVTATGAVAGSNLAADLTIGSRTAITIDSPTVALRYSANAGTTQYAPTARLHHGDLVELSGRIEHAGAVTTANDVMATDVGAAFRPAREVNLLVPQQGGAAATMRVNAAGQMIMLRTTATTWTSLDGVSYRKS